MKMKLWFGWFVLLFLTAVVDPRPVEMKLWFGWFVLLFLTAVVDPRPVESMRYRRPSYRNSTVYRHSSTT
jgi:hypothetical protein